jgi:hypothetical protein
MSLAEIEKRVAELDTRTGFEFIYDLLRAYGLPASSITRLQTGSYDMSTSDDECLWKNKVYYRYIEGDADMHVAIEKAQGSSEIIRAKPRFLIVRTPKRLVAVDTRVNTTLDIDLDGLSAHAAFFMPWAGLEKAQLEGLNYADIKAAEKMARLYDEIIRHNSYAAEAQVRPLNIFFSRLLFCFFAEDTGVFDEGSFTNAIGSLTTEDGTDTNRFLDELFKTLDTPPDRRSATPAHFRSFGYVNGNLFASESPCPAFSAKARRIILECGTLDWSEINPDIFGSMIQAVVHPSERGSLGMHYTSVENILRVLRPLLLDELEAAFDKADTVGKLDRLLSRLIKVRVFDPACGSGNFLIVAYRELRRLEHRVLTRIRDLEPQRIGLFEFSRIKLDNFHGIEIDGFAREIAVLSLWLAKHQMNVEFGELFGVEPKLIPLRESGSIVVGNAARMRWTDVCPSDSTTFVCGNPPYTYGTKRTAEQTADVAKAFDDGEVSKYLDYVGIWLYKGAQFISGTGASLGFVATNSICQGKQVGHLWPRILKYGVRISFARTSFRWTNNARANAGVSCVIVGLDSKSGDVARLASGAIERKVSHINPYLVATSDDTIVHETDEHLSPRPPMVFGSMPRDDGHLSLTATERAGILDRHPTAERFLKPYLGAAELLRGTPRYCIWIPDDEVGEAMSLELIGRRVEAVRDSRLRSKAASTRSLAASPHRFAQVSYQDAPCIVVPRVSSERREYVPMDYRPAGTVVSDAAQVVYRAEPWLFALLQSLMHIAWLSAVGGRMKTDYRYSTTLVYNTFPFPALDDQGRQMLNESAIRILSARESHSDTALGDIYDPETMPTSVAAAHHDNDALVDRLYRANGFSSNEERLRFLFDRYNDAMILKTGRSTHAQSR